jgi:anti-sigma factor RsiW
MTSQPSPQDGDMKRPVHLTDDELSAFVNGEIDEPETRERVLAHLDQCAECRDRLSETRAVVSLLNRLETPAPSRSFKLDLSMLAPKAVPVDPWIVRVQPALRRFTAIAAALLLVIVIADALAHGGSGGGSQSTANSQTTSAQMSSGGASTAAAFSSAATSAARDSQATTAESAGKSVPPQTASGASSTATAVSAVSQAPASSQSQGEPLSDASPSTQSGTSYWRLIELAVGVVVVWLLFLTVALPRLLRQRRVV